MNQHRHLAFAAFAALAGSSIAQSEGWQQVFTSHVPQGGERMVFDAARAVTLMFGGSIGNETWTYDGLDWHRLAPAHVPPGRAQHFMGNDPVRQRVLMYGGVAGSTPLGDTWEWDGADWTQVGSGADARYNGAMAFDPVRQQMLRFGGAGAGGRYSETRAWTGSQWLLLTSGGPAPRESVAMVTDSLRNRVVLYGGYGVNNSGFGSRFNDTWEWDGSVWMQRLTAFTPPYLDGHSMAFHETKGWTMIANGSIPQGGGPVPNNDLYAFDGNDWALRAGITEPTAGPLAYDSARVKVVTVGGGQTWEYTAPPGVPANYSNYGQGCPGSGGVPSLDVDGGDLPFIGYPLHLTLSHIGTSPFVLPFGVLGFSNANWNGVTLPADLAFLGFPGCTAYAESYLFSILANTSGTANWTIEIPHYADLVGVAFYLQAFVLDGGAPVGASVSNAGAGIIGQR